MRTYGKSREHRAYELKKYDPKWNRQFLDYTDKLKPILGDNLVNIEHMGSTSIKGMVAKPQIDILVVVKKLDSIKKLYGKFREAGFEPRGREYVGIGDEYVTLDDAGGKRLAGVHIFEEGHPAIEEDRLFRRYISLHPTEQELYIQTKKDLYKKYRDNYEGYDTGKGDVLKAIKSRARLWDKEGGDNP